MCRRIIAVRTKSLYRLWLVALLVTACGAPAFNSVITPVTQAQLHPGDPIPVPADGEVLFTISGLIGAPNVNDRIEMDMDVVESVGMVDYSVMDPFVDQQITYRGPLMSDLMAVWQVSPQATVANMVALNDYTVHVPMDILRNYPVVFAVQANGEYMSIEDRGPAMLVLPYDDYTFDRPASDAYWIWQIKSIEFE